MLPAFVIGLREGLEASRIVGIIAAFLRKQGRSDLVQQVAMGVGAVLIFVAGGVALKILDDDLPQRQHEGLETVVGVFAVVMVTYMVVWMAEYARDLRGQLESSGASALASGSSRALVVIAFLAVYAGVSRRLSSCWPRSTPAPAPVTPSALRWSASSWLW